MDARLELSGAVLAKALTHLARSVKPGKPGRGTVGFRDGMVRIGVGTITGKGHASGTWDGEARVPGAFLLGMAAQPPSGETVTITFESGELRIRVGETTLSAPAAWETAKPEMATGPVERTLLEKYRLSLTLSEGDLERDGLKTEAAEGARKAEQKIREATIALTGLDVSEEELRELVRRKATAKGAQ